MSHSNPNNNFVKNHIGFGNNNLESGSNSMPQNIGFNAGTPGFHAPPNPYPNTVYPGGEYCQNCGDFGHLIQHCQNPINPHLKQNAVNDATQKKDSDKKSKKKDEHEKERKKQEKSTKHKSDKKPKNKKKKDKSGSDSSDSSDDNHKKTKKKGKKNKRKNSSSSSSSSDSD